MSRRTGALRHSSEHQLSVESEVWLTSGGDGVVEVKEAPDIASTRELQQLAHDGTLQVMRKSLLFSACPRALPPSSSSYCRLRINPRETDPTHVQVLSCPKYVNNTAEGKRRCSDFWQ